MSTANTEKENDAEAKTLAPIETFPGVVATVQPPEPGTAATAPDETPVFTEEQTAAFAWAGISLHLQDLQHRIRSLVDNAQIHAPTKGRQNERILVYADRLHDLIAALDQAPATHAGAMALWSSRGKDTEDVAELRRVGHRLDGVLARLEKQAGIETGDQDKTPVLEKIEGMTAAMIDIVDQQARMIGQLKAKLGARTVENN